MDDAAFQPDWFSKPGDTLSALLAKRALMPAALAEQMGREIALVEGLLVGTVAINGEIAALLSKTVGASASFWIARQAQFEESLDRVAKALPSDQAKSWLKTLPLKDMAEAGWIVPSRQPDAAIKSSLSYFDVADPEEWRDRYTEFQNAFSFRTSPSFESTLGALSAWLRQGEIQAATIPCAAWNSGLFQAQLSEIRVLTKAKGPGYFIPRLRAICAAVGVAVVFVRTPSGCRASGATRFISPKKAMIILSFRYLSDDHFWFTFFHEVGHLLLHGNTSTFIDGAIADPTEKELEADTFSANTLIPPERQDALMNLPVRTMAVIRFATSIGETLPNALPYRS